MSFESSEFRSVGSAAVRARPRVRRASAVVVLAGLVLVACTGPDDASSGGVEDAAGADGSADATADGPPAPGDWPGVLAAAEGRTLDLHMWGGSTEINRFVDDTYGPRLAAYGITLNRVPLADTADAVNAVLGELAAGRTDDGSIDLIWINGENFATMRQADALLDGWAESLPNAQLVDWDDPSVAFDAGRAVDGAESPWGSAQFQFVYDEARTDPAELPRSYDELADWIAANPGRFTYPAPPAFHGTRLIKQWFYELDGDPGRWLGEVDEEEYLAAADPLWTLLEELRPDLWRGGATYPTDIAELDRLFANGEVDLTFTHLPAGIDAQIDAGVYPATARPYVFDTGTIADHHYLAIPVNAADVAAAMVFADLVLSPELQAAKLDPANGWGDGLVIATDRLAAEDLERVERVLASLGEASVPPEELEAARLPDSRGELTDALEREWDRFVRQRQQR